MYDTKYHKRCTIVLMDGGDDSEWGTEVGGCFQQWGQFDKLLGRAEASEADPEGRVPVWETASTTDIKEKFAPLGFKPRQVNTDYQLLFEGRFTHSFQLEWFLVMINWAHFNHN